MRNERTHRLWTVLGGLLAALTWVVVQGCEDRKPGESAPPPPPQHEKSRGPDDGMKPREPVAPKPEEGTGPKEKPAQPEGKPAQPEDNDEVPLPPR